MGDICMLPVEGNKNTKSQNCKNFPETGKLEKKLIGSTLSIWSA